MTDQKVRAEINALLRERDGYSKKKMAAEESLRRASTNVGRALAEAEIVRADELIDGVNAALTRHGVAAVPKRLRAERRPGSQRTERR